MSRDHVEKTLRALPEPDLTDADTPELTAADFARMKPPEEVLAPEVLAQFGKRPRGRPKADVTKEHVSLRLDPAVLAYFRSSGPGWQGRVEEVLREAMRREPHLGTAHDTGRFLAGSYAGTLAAHALTHPPRSGWLFHVALAAARGGVLIGYEHAAITAPIWPQAVSLNFDARQVPAVRARAARHFLTRAL